MRVYRVFQSSNYFTALERVMLHFKSLPSMVQVKYIIEANNNAKEIGLLISVFCGEGNVAR